MRPHPGPDLPQSSTGLSADDSSAGPGAAPLSAHPLPAHAWVQQITEAALALGFARVGLAPVERFERGAEALRRWLDAGHHGDMHYLAEQGDRANPKALLAEARTMVVVAQPYPGEGKLALRASKHGPVLPAGNLEGYVAYYARGADYHQAIRDKLRSLARTVSQVVGRPVASRICVDTAPLLERESAEASGFAFIGKNTLAIAPGLGSYFVLGELLLDVELPPTQPSASNKGCGQCRTCLDACPTGAFVSEYVLDARRCISYLTIEFSGVIHRELRPLLGAHVFGCDICQRVCPYNARAHEKEIRGWPPAKEVGVLDLIALLNLSATGYRRLVKNSALRRVHRATLVRNAAIALGNSGDSRAFEPLYRALLHDAKPLVRLHAAWAIGQLGAKLGGREPRKVLEIARLTEPNAPVREEIAWAREKASSPSSSSHRSPPR